MSVQHVTAVAKCRLCKPSQKCVFHKVADAAQLGSVLAGELTARGGTALADYLLAGMPAIEAGPSVLAGLGELDTDALLADLEDYTAPGEELTTDELRELAATAWALAIVVDANEASAVHAAPRRRRGGR